MSASEPAALYAPRTPIFPRRVSGRFRRLKWWLMGVTLMIYYVTPWLRWDRGPALPDQAVLVDLAGRRFFFFWIEIWPHEFYFVAGLLIMAGLGLFLFTSALGRVWCGYACPQTVWTDLFILVERWIEGDRNARVRLHDAPWSGRKLRLRLEKWALWLVISLGTGGAWIFYFADAPTLAAQLVSGAAHPVAYSTVAILTATTFIFGGFMREQVCIYMCPWPRIQGAMMDDDTLTVAYRDWRGEPRGRHRKAAALAGGATATAFVQDGDAPADAKAIGQATQTTGQATGLATGQPHAPASLAALGDCVDCNACVNVCPMGIDIRDGQQMECITCALCIDACDDVMSRLGKPRGLIDYLALSDEPRERAGHAPRPVWHHVLRVRTLVYTVLWAAIGIGLIYALFVRSEIDLTVAPARNPRFVTLTDGTIRNVYDVRLRNLSHEARPFGLSLVSKDPLVLSLEGQSGTSLTVPADTSLLQRVYVEAPASSAAATEGRKDLRLWVKDMDSGARAYADTSFNGKDLP